jgi:magnesium-transporting ATPase (P-type)
VGQVVRAYANRSLTLSIWELRPNAFLAAACVLVLVIHAAIPLVPPMAEAFRATQLTGGEWGLVLAIAAAPAMVAEIIRRLGHTWVA